MWSNPQETADLITFTEEILNGKLHFLCCDACINVHYEDANRNGEQLCGDCLQTQNLYWKR